MKICTCAVGRILLFLLIEVLSLIAVGRVIIIIIHEPLSCQGLGTLAHALCRLKPHSSTVYDSCCSILLTGMRKSSYGAHRKPKN